MRIVMVGSGYVGLVSGACLSEFGHDVVCVDKDAAKVKSLRHGGQLQQPRSTVLLLPAICRAFAAA